ncbi:hypothetical protein Tco_0163087 [Tanacetum coccineum]
MEELLRAPTEGYGEAIVIPEINEDHFEIKTNLLQLVQATPFHGFERDDPHTHINNFKRITSTLKFRNVPNDVINLMMFPYSLEGNARICEAWERFKEMLRACPYHGFSELTQVDTFYNGLNDNDQDSLNAAVGGNLLSKTTREALNIIENKSKIRYSRNKSNVSRMNTTSRESVSKTDERIDKLADQISTLVEIVSKKVVTPAPVKAVEEICVTCGGPHAYYNCPNTNNNQSSVCAATCTYNQVNPPNHVSNQMAPPGFAPVQNNGQNSNTIPNPKGEMKSITTRSGVAYEGPSIPTKPSPKKTLPKSNIPYPSRRNDQKSRDKASNQMEKIFQIFQDLRFDISLANSLLLMPRFAPTIKSLLMNKDKLFELAKIPLNENCPVMLLKKLPKKLGDPDFEADPRVPLILGRSFLRTGRALIDVYGEEITLRVNNEAEFSQEVLGFLNNSSGGNPTPSSNSILSSTTPSLTPFEGGDFILEEMETFLQTPDEFTDLDDDFYDTEGDILYLEKLLNEDPSPTLPPKKNKDLKEVTKAKPSIEEPPELELKYLPSHLEYAYLE